MLLKFVNHNKKKTFPHFFKKKFIFLIFFVIFLKKLFLRKLKNCLNLIGILNIQN